MKKFLFLAAICFIGFFSACTKQDLDLKVSLAGTKWEAIDTYQYYSLIPLTDRYVMEFTTEKTGTISYFPDSQLNESNEIVSITYIYNYPQIMVEGTNDGEKLNLSGMISADYSTITLDGVTFTRQ